MFRRYAAGLNRQCAGRLCAAPIAATYFRWSRGVLFPGWQDTRAGYAERGDALVEVGLRAAGAARSGLFRNNRGFGCRPAPGWSGNGSDVIARVDLIALRRSLVSQVVAQYFDQRGEAKPPSFREQLVVSAGAAAADAFIANLLTAENVTQLLKVGHFESPRTFQRLRFLHWQISQLVGADEANPFRQAGGGCHKAQQRTEWRAKRLSDASGGLEWKVSGLILPKQAVHNLIAKVRAK